MPTIEETRAYFDGLETAIFFTTGKPPALDDLPEHIQNLIYAAQKLDRIPAFYWLSIDKGERPDYIAQETIMIGEQNRYVPGGRFSRQAADLKFCLERYAWDEPNDFWMAQESWRILDAYIKLHDYFEQVGYPIGVTDF